MNEKITKYSGRRKLALLKVGKFSNDFCGLTESRRTSTFYEYSYSLRACMGFSFIFVLLPF